MSIFTTLRSIPTRMVEMLAEKGFLREMSAEDHERMETEITAFSEELFGATVAVADKTKKEKKTKAAVVTAASQPIDRDYLQTLNIQELKQLGKDCPAIKGRKPRAELIEIVLAHFAEPAPVEAEHAESPAESDEELREETPPEEKPKKKEKKPAEKKEKKPEKPEKPEKKDKKDKKEKKEKKEKEKEKDETPPIESDDEETVSLREWFHPNESSKPREERRKYYIDPKTNDLYHPDRLQSGQAEWTWNEETCEITPV